MFYSHYCGTWLKRYNLVAMLAEYCQKPWYVLFHHYLRCPIPTMTAVHQNRGALRMDLESDGPRRRQHGTDVRQPPACLHSHRTGTGLDQLQKQATQRHHTTLLRRCSTVGYCCIRYNENRLCVLLYLVLVIWNPSLKRRSCHVPSLSGFRWMVNISTLPTNKIVFPRHLGPTCQCNGLLCLPCVLYNSSPIVVLDSIA